ncbi:hypothetical protein MYXA107069_23855 [Myxococcus xanthus]
MKPWKPPLSLSFSSNVSSPSVAPNCAGVPGTSTNCMSRPATEGGAVVTCACSTSAASHSRERAGSLPEATNGSRCSKGTSW